MAAVRLKVPVLAMACALALCAACGPIEYVNQVSRKASSEVDAARAVQADKHAPYWFTLAVEYLHKAREEAAAADFQAANRFGRLSENAARKARAAALERARNPNAPVVVPTIETPAPKPKSPDAPVVDPAADDAAENPLDEAAAPDTAGDDS